MLKRKYKNKTKYIEFLFVNYLINIIFHILKEKDLI